jgi:hypothetical protein
MVVAAIAPVDVDAAGLDTGQPLDPGDDRSEGVPIEGIAVQRLGVQHELAALGPKRSLADVARLGGSGIFAIRLTTVLPPLLSLC